jgi:hypothetical protein
VVPVLSKYVYRHHGLPKGGNSPAKSVQSSANDGFMPATVLQKGDKTSTIDLFMLYHPGHVDKPGVTGERAENLKLFVF